MFLRSLLGTSALAAAPKVIYAFAPPGGWVLGQRVYSFKDVAGVLGPNTFIRRYLSLDEVERDFGPSRLEVLYPKLVQVLRTRRDEEWFL